MRLRRAARPLALVTLSALVIAGCASSDEDSSAAAAELAKSPEEGFQPMLRCIPGGPPPGVVPLHFSPVYIGELDMRDHAHPRYRIRHDASRPPHYSQEDIGKQNINLHFRDGTVWQSPDALVARFNSANGEQDKQADADARDPWSDLPVPPEVLAKAFSVKDGMYNLETAEMVFNFFGLPDRLGWRNDCSKVAFYPQ